MELPKIPRELEEAVRKNELLIFVGAGLSYNLINIKKQPLKGWSNLVHQILLHLKEEGHDVEALILLIDRYEPIDILRLIEKDKHFPRQKISEFIKDFLDLHDENNFDLHRKLYRLSNKIITTNYDCAFEKAVRELEKNTAYKGKNYELTKHKQPVASLLFKLHGCFKDVDSMVLYPSSYDALYQNKERDAEHSILVLRNIIFNKSILFIGAGMGDFQINNLFSEIKKLQGGYNQKHFIITKNSLDSSLDFLTPLAVSDFAQIEGIVDELIAIKEQSSSNESEQIKTLKAQFAASEERIKELEALINPDREKLLEREALKYFSRGVKYSLEGDYENAAKEYETAIELKPDFYKAWNNLGNSLGNLAKNNNGQEAEELFTDAFEKFQNAINIKPDFYEAWNNWGTDLGNLAKTKTGEEAYNLFTDAFEKYENAILLKHDSYETWNNWGTDLGNIARTKTGQEAEKLFTDAFEKFQNAIHYKPSFHEAWNNWGNYLGDLAQIKTGQEAEELFIKAFEKFQNAINFKPNKHEAWYNWGTDLGNLAKTKTGQEAEQFYMSAFDKYQKATHFKPDFYEAWYNWGTDISNLAKSKPSHEAYLLYNAAFEKYQKAIYFKPDFHEAWNNWGNSLGNLAKAKTGQEADGLFTDAFEKFQNAINFKPDKHESWDNWGNYLMQFARLKKGNQSENLFDQALEKLQKAVEYGGDPYNLACLHALRNQKEPALQHLKSSLENKHIQPDFVLQDEDWQGYLQDSDFLDLVKHHQS